MARSDSVTRLLLGTLTAGLARVTDELDQQLAGLPAQVTDDPVLQTTIRAELDLLVANVAARSISVVERLGAKHE